ncbi:MAG: FliH/SctL family protein [bacterium]
MSRIRSDAVIVGGSYVVGKDSAADLQKEEILNIARSQADSIIAQAQQNSQQMLQEASSQSQAMIGQAEEIQRQAHEAGLQNGFNEGYANGFEQISNELANQIKAVNVLAGAAFKVKNEIISSAEKEIVELTVSISEKILKNTLEVSPDIILNIVKAAIGELKEKEDVKITINPDNAIHIYQYSEFLKDTINGLKNIKIIEDRTVPFDGFIVESVESRIDAGISTQINEISRAFIQEAHKATEQMELPQEIEIRINEKIEEIQINDN